MELARAFTKRVKRPDQGLAHAPSIRNQISGPVALISTTNMLSYNAPDISRMSDPCSPLAPSTPTRSSLDEDSDDSTPSATSTAATSVESSPATDERPTQSYFPKTQSDVAKTTDVEAVPALPKRALTHSKREHERLSRQRSMRFSRPSSAQSTTDASTEECTADGKSRQSLAPPENLAPSPFSRELEQLNEVVEEFSAVARDTAIEEDLAFMQSRGLLKFGAHEYLEVIEPFWNYAFGRAQSRVDNVWI